MTDVDDGIKDDLEDEQPDVLVVPLDDDPEPHADDPDEDAAPVLPHGGND